MELEEYAVGGWPGWRLSRRSERSWWAYRGERYVGEIGVVGTVGAVATVETGETGETASSEEWWVRPDGEALPWAATHASLRAAVDALASWWEGSHPFGDVGG